RFWRNRSCARYEWTLRLLRDKPKRAMGLARTDDGHPASGCSRRSSHGWRGVTWIVEKTRALRHRVFLPVAKPAKFLDSEAITEQLQTPDAVLAGELLAYAREIAAAPQDRVEGVERRATTLLGTVGIATSLSVAGAA